MEPLDEIPDLNITTLQPVLYDHTVNNVDMSLYATFDCIFTDISFSQLTSLDLSRNNLSKICELPPTIKYLNMSFNCIRECPINNVKHLQYLSLRGNQIDNLSSMGLSMCNELVQLDISRNQLCDCRGVPSSLQVLDISYNSISSVHAVRGLSFNTQLRSIGIAGNPVTLSYDQLRFFLINLVPHLQLLDNKRK
jgi:Leucine-rich repeat (LRR) protein